MLSIMVGEHEMAITKKNWITREDLRRNSTTLFVFGDNLQEKGYGGQAKEMRGEPNAIGIPTKKKPSMTPDSFFSDDDLTAIKDCIDEKIMAIALHLEKGFDVVFPENGIGTNLAKLEEKAPKIHEYINRRINWLFLDYGKK